MAGTLKHIRIFLASPSGLERFREEVVCEVESYSKNEAIPRGVMFEVIRCEDIPKGFGNPQEQIDPHLCACDYYILVLHKKWGSPPNMKDSRFTSGVESEFHSAYTCLKSKLYPMQNMVIIFQEVTVKDKNDPDLIGDINKIESFKKKIFDTQGIYCELLKTQKAIKECIIKRYLPRWLREHENPRYEAELCPPKTVHDFFQDHSR